jgi:hypothetical protein
VRVLTVRQPYAWAIIHGGKDVENRVRNIAGPYRGPIAIHAALQVHGGWNAPLEDATGSWYQRVAAQVGGWDGPLPWWDDLGAIIGVVDLVDVHDPLDVLFRAPENAVPVACSPWAEEGSFHLVLANPRPLAEPIPHRGALHLQYPSPELVERITKALAA